jgi:hypothetical protein
MILMFIDDYWHEKLMGKVLIIGDLKKFYTSHLYGFRPTIIKGGMVFF